MSNPFDTNPYQPSKIPADLQQPRGPSQGLAITSLVCGIVGLVMFPFACCCCPPVSLPLPVIALITGGIVLANPRAAGRGMALAGVIMGGAALLLIVGLFVLSLLNPALLQQYQQQNFNADFN